MEKIIPKDHSNSYLYSMSEGMEKKIFEFIMQGEEIDKESEAFADIRSDLKRRQVTNSLVKVVDSKNIVLMISKNPLPKAFKVFCATDVKGDNKKRIFVDCSEIIRFKDGLYKCRDIDIFVAYMISAMTSRIYYADPMRIITNAGIINTGAAIFSSLFTHVIDYLDKISIVPSTKAKCIYLTSLYYITNILGLELNETRKGICRKISGISEREEDVIFIQLDDDWNLNIKFFIRELGKVLRLNKLTLEVFVEKWIFLYGTGTHFALELFPSFSSMVTDAYVGCYINNQKTIEKIIGRDLVNFSNVIFRIGSDALGK